MIPARALVPTAHQIEVPRCVPGSRDRPCRDNEPPTGTMGETTGFPSTSLPPPNDVTIIILRSRISFVVIFSSSSSSFFFISGDTDLGSSLLPPEYRRYGEDQEDAETATEVSVWDFVGELLLLLLLLLLLSAPRSGCRCRCRS